VETIGCSGDYDNVDSADIRLVAGRWRFGLALNSVDLEYVDSSEIRWRIGGGLV